jgi:GT2 family glycosyltransferase
MNPEVSIMIVHHNTKRLLRQTLKGIFRMRTEVPFEVIVVDNNPDVRIKEMVKEEFPEVNVVVSEKNVGFGSGMNMAIKEARGRHLFVFNPDIVVFDGFLEKLIAYMDNNPLVGMVGPKMLNPDKSFQQSFYRFMDPAVIFYRRVPVLRNMAFAKKALENYLMKDADPTKTQEVDYLLGAALFIRRKALEEVGGFDPGFFVYFEDQDLCRRFWMKNWKVVYYPEASLVHYHRRETAEGNFIKQIMNPLTRIQIKSAVYYYQKYKNEKHPRE